MTDADPVAFARMVKHRPPSARAARATAERANAALKAENARLYAMVRALRWARRDRPIRSNGKFAA